MPLRWTITYSGAGLAFVALGVTRLIGGDGPITKWIVGIASAVWIIALLGMVPINVCIDARVRRSMGIPATNYRWWEWLLLRPLLRGDGNAGISASPGVDQDGVLRSTSAVIPGTVVDSLKGLLIGAGTGAFFFAASTFFQGYVSFRSIGNWAVIGACVGLLAASLLLWPRAFPGVVLLLIGAGTAFLPVSHADGSPLPTRTTIIRFVVGGAIAGAGFALLVWARKRLVRELRELNNTQVVILRYVLQSGDHGSPEERRALQELASRIAIEVQNAACGTYDGDAFGCDEVCFYFIGTDAKALWTTIKEALLRSALDLPEEATLLYDGRGTKWESINPSDSNRGIGDEGRLSSGPPGGR